MDGYKAAGWAAMIVLGAMFWLGLVLDWRATLAVYLGGVLVFLVLIGSGEESDEDT